MRYFPIQKLAISYRAVFHTDTVQYGYNFNRNNDKHHKQTSSLYIRDV